MRLVYIGFAWTAGLVLAAAFEALTPLLWSVGLFLALIVLRLLWRSHRLWGVVLVMFALAGLRYSLLPTTSAVAAYNGTGGLTLEGVIVNDPDIRDQRAQFHLRVEQVIRGGVTEASSGRVLVLVPRLVDVQYGDRVRATGLLITPGEYDAFSYSDFLARRGVFSIMDQTAVEIISRGYGSPFYSALYDFRRDVRDAISRSLPEPQAGLLTGILLGNERGISPELDEDFKRVGASHVIAISGFNMVIIAGIVMQVLNALTARNSVKIPLALLVIAVYTIFTGANAAVIRAALMSGALIIGQSLRRKTYVPASLAFVALLMSIAEPHVLWDVSFQLSFFATLGLALFVDPLQSWFEAGLRRLFPYSVARSVGGFLSEPLIVTLAAMITTLPLTLLYFNRFSVVALLVNLLIVPAQTYLLILGGLATMLVLIVPAFAQFIYWLDMVLLSWTIGVVRLFARLPFADVTVYAHPSLIYGSFLLLIVTATLAAAQPAWSLRLLRFVRHRVVLSTTLLSSVAILILIAALLRTRPDGQLHVWFLDVGHSNGILIETPGGAHILIDGGRFPSRLLTAIGDRLPFNDREIEVLFITQPDELDVGALTAVLSRYDIGAAITNGQPNLSDAYLEIQTALAEHDVVAAVAGYTITLDDDVLIEVLHPQRTPSLAASMNDEALVLRLTYGEISFLLPGDLSADAQVAMLDAGQWPLASVLQLPQHGTSRSLDAGFLEAVQPQVIVIQTDKANRRGDPNPDVLAMLTEVPVYRTDESGTLHFWTDGRRLWVQPVK